MNICKKFITVIFAVVIIISFSAVAFADGGKTDMYRDYTGKTLIVAHKGSCENAPENSIRSINAAVSNGADIIEIDVRVTADGVLVLMEDETVERTCYGYGENIVVSEMTYDELSSLKLLDGHGGYGAKQTEEQVPTLEDVFKDRDFRYATSSQYPAEQKPLFLIDADWNLRNKIYNLAQEYNKLDEIILYTDASADEISAFKSDIDSEPMIMTYFKGNVIFAATANVKNDSVIADGIHLATANPYGVVFGKTVQNTAAESGIRTMAAPCMPEICGKIMQDTEEWWDYLISKGFSIIMTDHVAELKAYLDDCDEAKAELEKIYKTTVTQWTLPPFNSDNFHDYKLAYTNAVSAAEKIFSDKSYARSDIQQTSYELQKAYDEINAHYDEFEAGTAGLTITLPRILLCIVTVAVVVCAEIYVYKKKKKT